VTRAAAETGATQHALGALSARFGGSRRLAGAVAVGVMAGFLSGLFGVGGGILIVPGLVLILNVDQRLAHGTSLAAIIPIGIGGVIGYAIHGSVDWTAAGLIIIGATVGAVVGTHALQRISQPALRVAFAGLLVATAVRLLIQTPAGHGRGTLDAAMAIGLIVLGAASGTLAGLLGVGGGILIVPALLLLFSTTGSVAKGTSLFVIIPTAIVGTFRNVSKRNADLPVAATVGLLGVASAFGGSQLAVKLNPHLSAVLFAILLLAVAVRLLLRRRRGKRDLDATPEQS